MSSRWWRESLFRQREFRLFWIGETTSQFGSAVTWVALPLIAVQSLHANAMEVSLLTAATWLPWLMIGLVAGAWVDRLPKQPVMLLCDTISALLVISVPVADWCGVLSIGQLLAVALLVGVSTVFFTSAYHAFLSALVSGEDLVEANAKLQGSQSAAQIGGPGLAGGMTALAGVASGLVADAIGFLVSAVCLRSIGRREPGARNTIARRSLRDEVWEGMRFLLADPYLRPVTLAASIGNLTLTGIDSLLVFFLVRVVGVSAGVAGALMATLGVGGVVGALCARRLATGLGTARAVLCCYVAALPFMLLVPLTGAGVGLVFFVGYGVTGAGIVAGNVIYDGFVQRYCPPEIMGRIAATGSTIGFSCMPVGAALAGMLASTLGVRSTIWIMSAALVASGSLLVCSPYRRLRELPLSHSGSHKPELNEVRG